MSATSSSASSRIRPALDPARLATLEPLTGLPEAALAALAAGGRLQDHPAGTILRADAEEAHLLYLLSGELILGARGQKAVLLRAGTAAASAPLFSAETACIAAKAKADVQVLRLDACAVRDAMKESASVRDGAIASAATPPGLAPNTASETALIDTALAALEAAYEQGSLDLPAMPEVALRIDACMQDPDVGLDALADVARLDAAVAGYLIQVANSAFYAGRNRAGNVFEAVSRLGLETTRNLVKAIALRNMFDADDPVLRDRARGLWNQSVGVGAGAHALARSTRQGLDPERALLAGLLHRVGAIPILDHFALAAAPVSPSALDAALETLTARISVLVIDSWQLGADMAQVAEQWMDRSRAGTSRADYCDLVQIATACQDGTEDEALVTLSAFKRLGLAADQVAETRARVDASVVAMRALLGA